eukprot:212543-Pyramimonas_sp.AAC.1
MQKIWLWTLLVLFLGEPGLAPGVRPIVRAPVWGRIWSRHRRPVARNWELSLSNLALWGGAGL